jgi:hypothetical protein
MPVNELIIEFGGLCMHVQRTTPTRHFVLLPDMTRYHHEEHCPVLVAEPQYTNTQKAMMYTLLGRVLDFTDLADPIGTGQALPWTLNVSEYTNDTPVEDRFLTGTPDAWNGCLAARVSIPLGTSVQPVGKMGEINVENGFRVEVAGRTEARITLKEPVNELVVVDDITGQRITTLTPDADVIKFYILNIPLCDLNARDARNSHDPRVPLVHPQSFYWLLKDHCSTHKPGPRFFPASPVVGTGKPCRKEDRECPNPVKEVDFEPPEPEPYSPSASFWVDTHECTQGSGS